jgi:hypothetical protein
MVGRVQGIILAAGRSWRSGNGEALRRRFQVGAVRKRGTRSPRVGRALVPTTRAGRGQTEKSDAGGGPRAVFRDHQGRGETEVPSTHSPAERWSTFTGTGDDFCRFLRSAEEGNLGKLSAIHAVLLRGDA